MSLHYDAGCFIIDSGARPSIYTRHFEIILTTRESFLFLSSTYLTLNNDGYEYEKNYSERERERERRNRGEELTLELPATFWAYFEHYICL